MAHILTVNDVMRCPHGGALTLASNQSAVTAMGGRVLRASDTFSITGCIFTVGGAPHPCVSVAWQNPAGSCKAGAEALLTASSVGMCKAADQAPQGTVLIQQTQTTARAR